MGRTRSLPGSCSRPGGCGSRAARDHERTHRSPTKRRRGVRRRRHVALDARVRGERPADAVRARTRRGDRAAGRARGRARRDRVVHRPRLAALVPHGGSTRLPRDDARGRRHRATAAVHVFRHERHDARRARCRADLELLLARGEEARAGGVHRWRQPARVERSRHRLCEEASNRRHVRADGRHERADLLERRGGGRHTNPLQAPPQSSRRLRLQFAVVFSTRAGSTRQPRQCASRSEPARPSVAASRATGAR